MIKEGIGKPEGMSTLLYLHFTLVTLFKYDVSAVKLHQAAYQFSVVGSYILL